MKKLVKTFLAFACTLSLSSAFAFDFGFLLDNNSTFKTNSDKKMYLLQKDSASAWVKVPFGQNVNNYFVAEGLYKFELNQDAKTINNYLDFNLLKVSFLNQFDNGSLKVDLGRYLISDATGIIFAQKSDGAFVKYSNSVVELSAYAGYTGLLNGNVVSMINSEDFEGCDSSKLYSFAEKNVVAILTASFPYAFADQTVSVQGTGSFKVDGNSYNRIYATVGMNGPVSGNLFYNVSGTVAMISYNGQDFKVSPLVKGDVTYYWPVASVGVNAVWAGKDFAGITSQTALNSMEEPEYSDLLKAGIAAKVKPVDNLVVSVSGDVAFDGTKDYELKGVQYLIGADYQIVSDVSVGASWVQYFDINKTDSDYQAISVKAKVAF